MGRDVERINTFTCDNCGKVTRFSNHPEIYLPSGWIEFGQPYECVADYGMQSGERNVLDLDGKLFCQGLCLGEWTINRIEELHDKE